MLKKILILLAGVLIIIILLNFDLLRYGIAQARGQLTIIINARPINEVITDPDVDPETKEKLDLVGEIKQFSISHLGLKSSRNYTTYYDQKGEALLWVVRASKPFALESKEWSFPFVGTVSYKGYFDKEKAVKLMNDLTAQGYDTYMREVSAWSTLGWFRDPILSGMLERDEGRIANTIIHELTHATLFISDQLDFNENLASFIGDKGAEFYLDSKYGDKSPQRRMYVYQREDRELLYQHFLEGTNRLDSLYSTFDVSMDSLSKHQLKYGVIDDIISEIQNLPLHDSLFYQERYKGYRPNNAYFMSYKVYRGKQSRLDSLFRYQYNSDIIQMIDGLKSSTPEDINELMN